MVGRAAGGQQRDDAVDERALVDDLADRRAALASTRRAASSVSARRSGVPGLTKLAPGQVQAHRLDDELVGVRGAVEGAGAGRVVGLRLGLEQLLAADLALGVELADAALLGVRAGRAASGRRGRRRSAGGRRTARRSAARARSCRTRRASARRRTCRARARRRSLIATTSRLNSDSSMPARPCVMPSHMAGTPPANWATPPACSTAFLRIAG